MTPTKGKLQLCPGRGVNFLTRSFIWALLCIVVSVQGDEYVDLRSIRIVFSQPSGLLLPEPTPSADPGGGPSAPSGSGNGAADRPSPADEKPFLVRYRGDPLAVRGALVSAGVRIPDIVGDKTLLTYGDPAVITSTAAQYDALVAEYIPEAKISPETAKVASSVQQAKEQQAARRRLLAELPSDATSATNLRDEVQSSSHGSSFSASVGTKTARALRLLSGLQTWNRYTRLQAGLFGSEERAATENVATTDGNSDVPQRVRSLLGEGTDSRAAADDVDDEGPILYGFSARIMGDDPEAEKVEVLKRLPEEATKALNRSKDDACRPQFADAGLLSARTASSGVLHVYFCAEDISSGVAWLSNWRPVLWIEPLLKATPSNAVAGWIVQTGNLTADQFSNPAGSMRPYWNAGLQGQGVIVGLGDTGIDLSNCYFLDNSSRPGSLRTQFVGNPPRLALPRHRKVIQYMLPEHSSLQWFGDDPDGHGTSVASCIAGSVPLANGSLMNQGGTGAAPLARLSFFDYKLTGQAGDGLFIPRPVADKILPYHYEVGGRLNLEAWTLTSSLATKYLEDSRSLDTFMWRHPEFLSVVPAGNFGANRGMLSIVAPATAKNVLTVGASINNPKDLSTSPYNRRLVFRYRDSRNVLQQQPVWPSLGSDLGAWMSIFNQVNTADIPVRLANPEHACTRLSGNFTGAVVLVDTAVLTCSFNISGKSVSDAFARAVIFIAPEEGFVEESLALRTSAFRNINISIPFGFIGRIQGLSIKTVLRTITSTTRPVLTAQIYPSVNYGIESLLPSSGSGLLTDGRIKPDVVAPGGLVATADAGTFDSEANGNTCSRGLSQKEGTSFAAGVATGHLALVHQYFRDGYYPTGAVATPASTPFEPSGMLVKAAAIAGADSLTGGWATSIGRSLGQAPDGYQGWGRLDLSGALPLPGLTSPSFRIQVADYGTISRTGDYIFLRGLRATGTGPVRAVLVWNDYPGAGSSTRDLVNDLDFGYQLNTRSGVLSFSRTRSDAVNNVERVELNSLRANDNITLVVYARAIRHTLLTGPDAQIPQRWAVYVAGHFTGTLKSNFNPSFMRSQRLQQNVQGSRTSRLSIQLPNNECMAVVSNNVVVSSTECNSAASIFTFSELQDTATRGYMYLIRDSSNRCLSVTGFAVGSRLVLATCNSASRNQRMAFFRNPFSISSFMFVPQIVLGSSADNRRCVQKTTSGTQSILTLAACNEDSPLQSFGIERPPSVPFSPPLPPSPPPPRPSPEKPTEEVWYPYPLLFRTDFFPVNGSQNLFDYDYGSVNDTRQLSQLDVVVSWTVAGVFYQVGWEIDDEVNAPTGVVHDGSNEDDFTMYETVHWEKGFTPATAAYDVCVSWNDTTTQRTKVVLTVFRGNAVARITKTFDTGSAYRVGRCNSSSPGYVGSYNFTTTLPPVSLSPAEPSPPPPPMTIDGNPLIFRADWVPLSGYVGRQNQLVDLDLVVAWIGNDPLSTYQELGYYSATIGNGSYGGDNMAAGRNYEFVYWRDGTTPPSSTLNACIRWFGRKKPLMQVTFTLFLYGNVVQKTVKNLDTTLTRETRCDASSIGFLGNITLPNGFRSPPPPSPSSVSPPPRPPPPPPRGCADPVAPTKLFTLYFRIEWLPRLGGPVTSALYDLDLVVSWAYNGEFFELSKYQRFVAGGVFGGDNAEMSNSVNAEVAYWPSGLTGVTPVTADYHICVRWFTPGDLNVTLTVRLGEEVVKVSSRAVTTSDLNNKYCIPGANGYISSYSYRPPTNSSGGAGIADVGTSGSSWDFELPGNLPGDLSSGGDRAGEDKEDQGVADGVNGDDGIGGGASSAGSSPAADPSGVPTVKDAISASDSGLPNSGVEGNNSDGSAQKGMSAATLAGVIVAAVVGTVLLAGLTVLAVRWRRSTLREARVVAM